MTCVRCGGSGRVFDMMTASIRTDTLPPEIPCPACTPAKPASSILNPPPPASTPGAAPQHDAAPASVPGHEFAMQVADVVMRAAPATGGRPAITMLFAPDDAAPAMVVCDQPGVPHEPSPFCINPRPAPAPATRKCRAVRNDLGLWLFGIGDGEPCVAGDPLTAGHEHCTALVPAPAPEKQLSVEERAKALALSILGVNGTESPEWLASATTKCRAALSAKDAEIARLKLAEARALDEAMEANETCSAAVVESVKERDAALARVEVLRGHLARYGDHLADCDAYDSTKSGCSCGFHAALKGES